MQKFLHFKSGQSWVNETVGQHNSKPLCVLLPKVRGQLLKYTPENRSPTSSSSSSWHKGWKLQLFRIHQKYLSWQLETLLSFFFHSSLWAALTSTPSQPARLFTSQQSYSLALLLLCGLCCFVALALWASISLTFVKALGEEGQDKGPYLDKPSGFTVWEKLLVSLRWVSHLSESHSCKLPSLSSW